MTLDARSKKQALATVESGSNSPLLKGEFLGDSEETSRFIGYGRVSTEDQSLDLQLAALSKAAVLEDDIFVEKISAVNAKRPQFHLMMKFIEPGDTLFVYSLSRLSRELKTLLAIVDAFKAMGVTLRSLTEPHIDPTTSSGRLLISISGAVDQHEREKIRERTRDGMQELKRQGMSLGRAKLFNPKQTAQIKRDRKTMTREQVAKKWKCSPGTIDKYAN